MWMRAFSVQPPSEPGVHLSAHRALQRFMPRARPGLRGSSHFLPRSRRTSSTTSASALRIPHGSLIVHRLCPFALWTVISGLQIGRTLPRRKNYTKKNGHYQSPAGSRAGRGAKSFPLLTGCLRVLTQPKEGE